jgi:phage terminase large subunit GpA-like protein
MTINDILRNSAARIKPPLLIRVSEWANKYRMLSPESSSSQGKFKTNRVPFMREIMDAMGDPTVAEVRVMKSSQVGYSEALNNAMAREMHINPSSLIMMQPTLQMGEAYSKDRIAPMIRDTPVLSRLIDDRSKTSGNTILQKMFPGGFLQIVGANSPASLASRPIRSVYIDEEDRTGASAGGEGDPEKLLERRQITYADRKKVAGGTPVVPETSKTYRGYMKGDQRNYMVECPHCGKHHALILESLQCNPEMEHLGEMLCPHCNTYITEKSKAKMTKDKLAGGTAYWLPTEKRLAKSWDSEKREWSRQREEVEYLWEEETGSWREQEQVVRSYYINALYSPFITWSEIANEKLACGDDPDLLQTFYNTLIGKPYAYKTHDLDEEQLYKRREEWSDDEIPSGILVLTMGVDTHETRFEYKIVGWGVGEEAWILDVGSIEGDPDDKSTRDRLIEFYETRKFSTKEGRELKPRAMFIDTGGHRTDAVHRMVRGRQAQRIFGCKGMNTPGNPIFSGYRAHKEARVRTAQIGTDTAKETIFARLSKDPNEGGTIHFNQNLSREYFVGLISEERVVKVNNGQIVVKYEKKAHHVRNEPLDCFVYAWAALHSLKLQLRRRSPRAIEAEAKAAEMARKAEDSAEAEDEEPAAPEPKKDKKQITPKRKSRVVRVERSMRRRP